MVCCTGNLKLKILKSRPEIEKSGPSFQILGPGPEPETRARKVGPEPEPEFSNFRARARDPSPVFGPGPDIKSPAPDKHCFFSTKILKN